MFQTFLALIYQFRRIQISHSIHLCISTYEHIDTPCHTTNLTEKNSKHKFEKDNVEPQEKAYLV